jgi:signal transduction histidine kinase
VGYRCPLEEIKKTKKPVIVEHMHYDREGKRRTFEVHGYPILDHKANVAQIIEYSLDVTQRVQAEEALRRSLEEAARGQRLLLALSRAAQSVERARTAEEVYRAIGEQVAGLGYNATVFTLTEDQAHLVVSYLNHPPVLLRAAEKLAGLFAQGYRFPLTPSGFYGRIVAQGDAAFTAQDEGAVLEAVPRAARPLVDQLMRLFSWKQSIVAPLVVHGQVYGLLSVTGGGLTEADVPAVSAFANQAAIAIENAQLLEQVVRQRRNLERLSAQLIDAQEMERGRISRELHDEIGQALTAISINLAEMEKERTSERLAETRALADDTLEQVRALALDLRPSLLDDLGLVPALRWYVNRHAQRLDIPVELEVTGSRERLPPEVAIALYRIVQEALTNVARHAHATHAHVRLGRNPSGVVVIVEDDGQGFDVEELAREAEAHGVGLIGMRERVALLGGRFLVESHPGRGTRLWVEIPLEEGEGR